MNETRVETAAPELDNVKLKELVSVAGVQSADGFGNLLVDTYGTYFYTDICGINAGAASMFMMMGKIFDFFTDFTMGAIIDKNNPKKGKVKPWIVWATIPYALAA